jgi:hypothetical protein
MRSKHCSLQVLLHSRNYTYNKHLSIFKVKGCTIHKIITHLLCVCMFYILSKSRIKPCFIILVC